MADDQLPPPFKVNRDDFPTSGLRYLLNPKHCFAQGNFEKTGNHIALGGLCRLVQFGTNPKGKNCMFVLDGNVSPSENPLPPHSMMAMSLQFNDMGRVDDVRFGNGAASWQMNIPNGTHASFGYLPTNPRKHSELTNPADKATIEAIELRLKTEKATLTTSERDALLLERKQILEPEPLWGCTRVLKGSFDFFGCERNMSGEKRANPSIEVVDGYPYVSCVQASRVLDEKFQMSPEDVSKIQPFFEHDFVNRVVRHGTHSTQFYDGEGFGNLFGIAGHDSFVHLNPNGSINAVETRNGHPVKPIPRHLSVLVPETRTKFEAKLKEGVATLKTDMNALQWLASHPLHFPPGGDIPQPFVNDAFRWVQDLSMQCKPYLDLKASHPTFPRRTPQSMAPAMSRHLFKMLTTPLFPGSEGSKKIMKCKCTATEHDKLCKNAICPWYAKLESDRFIWPRFEFEPNAEQPALLIEKTQMKLEQTRKKEEKERTTQAAATAATAATEVNRTQQAKAHKKRMEELAKQNKAITAKLVKKKAEASAAQALGASAAQAPALGASAAQASAAQASAAPAPALGAVSRNRVSARKQASAAVSAAAAPVAPVPVAVSRKRALSSTAPNKRSKQGGTRRRRRLIKFKGHQCMS